jgi:hypothetical protein
MGANRDLHDIDGDLLAACLCLGALVDHINEHGLANEQVLTNIERASEGFRRLMAERRVARAA